TARSYTFLSAASTAGAFGSVTELGIPNGFAQATAFDPVSGQRVRATTIVAPTNDTVFTAAGSVAVLNGQRANSIILDRLGNRQAGSASGQIAAVAPVQYAQA